MGIYRKLTILTCGTLGYAWGMLASALVYATQYARVRYKYATLLNFFDWYCTFPSSYTIIIESLPLFDIYFMVCIVGDR